jgi:lysophospholipase L1-like esterase
MTKTSWARLILIVVSVSMALGVSEAMLRWLRPQEPTPTLRALGQQVHISDARYGWKLRPDYTGPFAFGSKVAVNSIGLRDVEYAPKAPGEIRILSLGDSYTFGWGVELHDSFVKVLERKLRDKLATTRIAVVNAGVTGYSTRQELLALADLYDVIRPDMVLVTFAATNDVYENHVFEERLRQGILAPLGPISRRSHVARLVLRATWSARFFAANRSPTSVRETLSLLDRLQSEAESRHLPLLMLMMPARAEIDPSARRSTSLMMKLHLGGLLSRPRQTVTAHWSGRLVDHIDLLPALSDARRKTDVFLPGDPHFNPEGNRVVAEAIFNRVAQMVSDLKTRGGL